MIYLFSIFNGFLLCVWWFLSLSSLSLLSLFYTTLYHYILNGVNDLFDVQVGERLESCTNIQIYNRWGVLVFESYGNNHSWDGTTFTGKECAMGVYIFRLNVNGTEYKGTVTLLR